MKTGSYFFTVVTCAVVAVCLILPWACQSDSKPDASPNVLFIVVDTLRKDHLQPYGYEQRATSPALAELAADSILVDGFTCVSSWTIPSMASMFTGLYPAQHGLMRMPGVGTSAPQAMRLQERQTLAQQYQNAGYDTACIMSNFLLARRLGTQLDRGFEVYDDDVANPDPNVRGVHEGSSAAEVAGKGMQWLAQRSGDRPWFLTLHFFDPHSSYENHDGYGFEDPGYQGWVRGGLSNEEYRRFQSACNAADLRQLRAYYDEEVRAVDDAIKAVLDVLRQRKDWQQTLVVFTSDHGEELAERGYIGHTQTLHFEQVDLPLIVRLPKGEFAGRRVDALLPQAGLYATLLDLCGLPVPSGRVPSFAAVLKGDTDGVAHRVVPIEVDFVPARTEHSEKFTRKRAAYDGAYKLVRDLQTGRESLYYLKEDPQELRNVLGQTTHKEAQQRLQQWMDEHSWWQEP